jgi:hypothetical protein
LSDHAPNLGSCPKSHVIYGALLGEQVIYSECEGTGPRPVGSERRGAASVRSASEEDAEEGLFQQKDLSQLQCQVDIARIMDPGLDGG